MKSSRTCHHYEVILEKRCPFYITWLRFHLSTESFDTFLRILRLLGILEQGAITTTFDMQMVCRCLLETSGQRWMNLGTWYVQRAICWGTSARQMSLNRYPRRCFSHQGVKLLPMTGDERLEVLRILPIRFFSAWHPCITSLPLSEVDLTRQQSYNDCCNFNLKPFFKSLSRKGRRFTMTTS